MNLPQVEADVKAVCHMMRARSPSSSSSEVSEARSEDTDDQGYPVDNGPTLVGASHWRLNQNTMTIKDALNEPDAEEFVKAMIKEDHVCREHWIIKNKSRLRKNL